MLRVVTAVMLMVAAVLGTVAPAPAQVNNPLPPIRNPLPPPRVPTPTPTPTPQGGSTTVRANPITPLGWYVMGGVACAAVSPMIGTILLNREMTASEVGRSTLSCFLGPVGWLLGPILFPVEVGVGVGIPPQQQVQTSRRVQRTRRTQRPRRTKANNITIPRRGEADFVPDEILIEFEPGTSAQYIARFRQHLQVSLLETQTFALTGRTIERWHIDNGRSVRSTMQLASGYDQISAGQPNNNYHDVQAQPSAAQNGEPPPDPAQYVVRKLHLLEAHRITNGDDVLVAVIDSKIDTKHPDLAGVFAGEFDALGTPAPAHMHGTGMAGAIAAHSKLLGVAPKVKLLAVRAFAGEHESAQGTTFNILKGVDWAASKGARIINMSFAGPADNMLRNMLDNAELRGIVLIAAVGNAGPRSPPLYPAADAHVIGVTATDINDKLLKQANRGPQVDFAAPGVEVLVPAPDASYQMTTGTSVAAANATGVAALLLARNPKLTPAQVRALLIKSAHKIPGKKRDVGAGVIDALRAVDEIKN
jgi:subtilisin family serine protease